ncbi:hypothetical protein [Deinococcus sp.]|uniref:hypothetical protein n=1 Tax=Deinococcus sp. TaxID=47478 RepID=UPI003B5BC83F
MPPSLGQLAQTAPTVGQRLLDTARAANLEGQVQGSEAYASPEQAKNDLNADLSAFQTTVTARFP